MRKGRGEGGLPGRLAEPPREDGLSGTVIPSFRAVLSMVALAGLALTGCLSLLAVRVALVGNPFYTFLGMNLLLACIPLGMAAVQVTILRALAPGFWRTAVVSACAAGWLIFYPNAPYLFTDFIHIVEKTWIRSDTIEWLGVRGVLWYDIVMSGAFAFVGHFLGLLSMWVEGRVLESVWGRGVSRVFLGAAVILAGFGVYLGRFARLNSWDAVLTPVRAVKGALEALADPKAMLFSLAFSFFVAVTYGMLVLAFSLREPPQA